MSGLFDDDPQVLAQAEPWNPKQGPAKLFFGLRLKPVAAAEIWKISASLDRTHGIHGNLRKEGVLHITLHELGDYKVLPKLDVIRARHLAETVDSPIFDLVLNRAMTFLRGPYVLLVGEGLEQVLTLEEHICIAMKRAGWPLKKRLATPHMTLSYKGRPVAEHQIEPIRWHVDEFVLINSHSGETHHEVVGTWPLHP